MGPRARSGGYRASSRLPVGGGARGISYPKESASPNAGEAPRSAPDRKLMRSDDAGSGTVLSRRELLTYLGASGAVLLAGWPLAGATGDSMARAHPSCVARPEQTMGPFFVDERLNRSDIRSDPATCEQRTGVPLDLTFNVSQLVAGSCSPLASAVIDVWHCDGLGTYSDVEDRRVRTIGQRFLRGYQLTDASGTARFHTIYPGWYPGRTVHIHFRIHGGSSSRGYEFASQLYFPDELTDRVHAHPPYSQNGRRATRNGDDFLYRHGGDQLLVKASKTADGYSAAFDVGLALT